MKKEERARAEGRGASRGRAPPKILSPIIYIYRERERERGVMWRSFLFYKGEFSYCN